MTNQLGFPFKTQAMASSTNSLHSQTSSLTSGIQRFINRLEVKHSTNPVKAIWLGEIKMNLTQTSQKRSHRFNWSLASVGSKLFLFILLIILVIEPQRSLTAQGESAGFTFTISPQGLETREYTFLESFNTGTTTVEWPKSQTYIDVSLGHTTHRRCDRALPEQRYNRRDRLSQHVDLHPGPTGTFPNESPSAAWMTALGVIMMALARVASIPWRRCPRSAMTSPMPVWTRRISRSQTITTIRF